MTNRPPTEPEPADSLRAARRRLRRTLRVDGPLLDLLRRAAAAGGGRELAALGWAAGAAPEELDQEGPLAAAAAYASAADRLDDGAVQFGAGLANAGGFGRRRTFPLHARQAFAAAARLDPTNALSHLGVALTKLAAGDDDGAASALEHAARADRLELFLSPFGAALAAESPWLTSSLYLLWPWRTAELVEAVVGAMTKQARREGATASWLIQLERLAGRLLTVAVGRPEEMGLAVTVLARSLAARERLLADQAAGPVRDKALGIWSRAGTERRSMALSFESAVRRRVLGAEAGVLVGLGVAGYGGWRSRRRWPPPFPLTLAGRHLALLGLGAAGLSAGSVLVANPVAAAHRRSAERFLLGAEQALMERVRDQLQQLLAGLSPLAAPAER